MHDCYRQHIRISVTHRTQVEEGGGTKPYSPGRQMTTPCCNAKKMTTAVDEIEQIHGSLRTHKSQNATSDDFSEFFLFFEILFADPIQQCQCRSFGVDEMLKIAWMLAWAPLQP